LAFWRLGTDGFAALPPITSGTFTLAGATGAVGLTLYAMLGLESAAMPVDAVEQPEKNIPRATLAGTGISAIVSLLATCAVALMLPQEVVVSSNAPTSDFLAASFGTMSGTLVAACAVVSAFGCLNGWLLLGGEVPVAMAQAGSLPDWFGRLNRHGAPAHSIVLGAVVTSAMTLLAATKVGIASYNFLILIATATNLLLYLLCVVAAARLMRDGRVRRSAGLAAATGLAFVFVLWAFYGSGGESLAWGAVLTAAGWPIYRLAQRLTSR
jgi:APA family basic amino acid/polyamine antiporter